jgi:hypothetical protein
MGAVLSWIENKCWTQEEGQGTRRYSLWLTSSPCAQKGQLMYDVAFTRGWLPSEEQWWQLSSRKWKKRTQDMIRLLQLWSASGRCGPHYSGGWIQLLVAGMSVGYFHLVLLLVVHLINLCRPLCSVLTYSCLPTTTTFAICFTLIIVITIIM